MTAEAPEGTKGDDAARGALARAVAPRGLDLGEPGQSLSQAPRGGYPDRPVTLTLAAAGEGLAAVVDAIAAVDRELAVVSARRAVLVDQARQWSGHAADSAAREQGREQATTFERHQAERSLVAEIACALRVPEGTASGLVLESQALVHEHPSTMSMLGAGAFSYRHAQTILDATTGLDESARATLDTTLSAHATSSTVAGLRRYARRQRERCDSRPLLERHRVAAHDRHVELQPCQDGMAWLHQYLPAVQAPDEPRTLAQLRADASVDLLLDDDARTALTAATVTSAHSSEDRAVENGDTGPHTATRTHESIAGIADRISLGGIKPQVAVTIPVMTLLGHSDEPGDLAGYGPIDATTARRLAAQAPSFLRILTHPETGTVLSVGRDRYAVPADLKSWLRIRDETCRFPGCSRRAQRCDIDHITDWAHGGTTDHHNLIHLCHHHRLKHTTAWTVHTEPGHRTPTRPPDHDTDSHDAADRDTSSRTPSRRDTDSRAPAVRDSAGRDPVRRDTPGRDPASNARDHDDHDAPPLTADVVRWTAPTGRTYLDHAAVTIAASTAGLSTRERPSPAVPETDEPATTFPEDPPF